MKKITISAFALLSIVSVVSSCTKDNSTPATPAAVTSATNTPLPGAGNADGALICQKVDVISTTGSVTVTTDNAIATFFTSLGNSGSHTEAGTVSVNSYALGKQNDNSYMISATTGQNPADLSFSSNDSKWAVSGSAAVPAFSYTNNTPFPAYGGAMPDVITRSNGITVSLAGNVSDADSVIVFIAKGNTSVTHTFAGTATSAIISANELAALPVVTDNTALMEVIPYRTTISTLAGKKYAFIKEHATASNININ